jgi:hypothetical protein
MERNRILASDVVLALGCAATATAQDTMARNTQECADEAMRLRVEIGNFAMTSAQRQVLLRLDQLRVCGDGSIQVPASDETALAEYPEYVDKNYTEYRGEIARLLQSESTHASEKHS